MIDTLNIYIKQGLLLPMSSYQPSPHQDERPVHLPIDMLVIHNISLPPGEFGSTAIEDFFGGRLDVSRHEAFKPLKQVRVSSHLLIKRTGEVIQFVPFDKRAWHAGESYFAGRSRCNDFSIGIELEGTDDVPYEPVQYEQLVTIIPSLISAYPAITIDRIVGHKDIAPHRKTDPGPFFDWVYLRKSLIEGS
jgi:AmpD protein